MQNPIGPNNNCFDITLYTENVNISPEVNFLNEAQDIVLHVCFRLSEDRIVFNCKIDGAWQEQSEVPITFFPQQRINLTTFFASPSVLRVSLGHAPEFTVELSEKTNLSRASLVHHSDVLAVVGARRIGNAEVGALSSGSDDPRAREKPIGDMLAELRHAKDLLIVGSAPTIEAYRKEIVNFDGDIWALNDASFWLLACGAPLRTLFINDERFLAKAGERIRDLRVDHVVTLHTVSKEKLLPFSGKTIVLRSLGRDGFSTKLGYVFHGCSVFHTALQCAVALGYKKIRTSGVLFPAPSRYQRVDGSTTLPEYVLDKQLSNLKNALDIARRKFVVVSAMEPVSNINFL